MVRILCIGNRFAYPDDFGIAIYERLKGRPMPGVEVVEGGVGGMSLAPYFEDDARLLIVDYGEGMPKKILTPEDVAALRLDGYDHASAFLYLLKSVNKPYRLYLCREPYRREAIDLYAEEIAAMAEAWR